MESQICYKLAKAEKRLSGQPVIITDNVLYRMRHPTRRIVSHNLFYALLLSRLMSKIIVDVSKMLPPKMGKLTQVAFATSKSKQGRTGHHIAGKIGCVVPRYSHWELPASRPRRSPESRHVALSFLDRDADNWQFILRSSSIPHSRHDDNPRAPGTRIKASRFCPSQRQIKGD